MPDAPDLPENLKEVNSERHLTTLASITITPASVEKSSKEPQRIRRDEIMDGKNDD